MLHAQSGEIALRLREIKALAHREAGAPFNLESPKQLQQILFEKLQLPVMRKTPTRHAIHRRGCARGARRRVTRCRG